MLVTNQAWIWLGEWWKPGRSIYYCIMTKDVEPALFYRRNDSNILRTFAYCAVCSFEAETKDINISLRMLETKSILKIPSQYLYLPSRYLTNYLFLNSSTEPELFTEFHLKLSFSVYSVHLSFISARLDRHNYEARRATLPNKSSLRISTSILKLNLIKL